LPVKVKDLIHTPVRFTKLISSEGKEPDEPEWSIDHESLFWEKTLSSTETNLIVPNPYTPIPLYPLIETLHHA